LVGKDGKRQLTVVFAGSMSEEFLPPQLIYQGKQHVAFHIMTFHQIGT